MPEKTTQAAYGVAALLLWLGQLDWATISMVGGLLLGILTFFVNWYYRRKALKIYEAAANKAAEKGYILNEPKQ